VALPLQSAASQSRPRGPNKTERLMGPIGGHCHTLGTRATLLLGMHDLRPLTEAERRRAGEAALKLGKALCKYHPSQIYMSDRQTIGFLRDAAQNGFLEVGRIEHIRQSLERHRIEAQASD